MENFDKIQRYLLNEMSSDEHQIFEEEVSKNEELAMELELQRFEVETIDQLEEDSLKEKANQLKKQLAENKEDTIIRPLKSVKNNYRRLFFITAVAASVLLLAGVFIFNSTENSSVAIITLSYDNARLDFGNRRIKSDVSTKQVFQSKYVDILKNRDKANVEEAIVYFSNFSSTEEKDKILALLNLGHSYLLADQFNDAIITFEKLEKSTVTSHAQMEEATFFRAMALFGDGQKKEAIAILEKLAAEGNNYDALAKKSLGWME